MPQVWGRFDERWLADFREMFVQQEFAGIFPFSGTKQVLETLAARGVSLGIASNRQRPGGPLKAVGLESYFSSVVGMDDVEKGKPAPDMLLKGMTDLGGTPATTLYVGDTAHGPYGPLSIPEVRAHALAIGDDLVDRGVKALVIACNTATGVSLETLRQELPIPVLGIQPALEAAQALRQDGAILALATPATFKTRRYQALYAAHGDHVIDLPAPGLMEFVEREELSGEKLRDFLAALFAP